MSIPFITLCAVLLLIAVRQIGSFRVRIWEAMTAGALIVLLTGAISLPAAWHALDFDVLFFLFGMFIVGKGLELSGYLGHVSYRYFKRARTRDALLLMILLGGGITSAFLMNDTLAIIGTPVMLLLARKHEMSPTLLLMALAVAVTTGSVCSPIGNPQNLLIATNGQIDSPFLTFFRYLFLPTLASLLVSFVILRKMFPDEFRKVELRHSAEPIHDHALAALSRISLGLLAAGILVKIVLSASGVRQEFRLTYIAMAAALPILVASPRRLTLIRGIDWSTIVFFASMFVLMQSVWQTGIFRTVLGGGGSVQGSPALIIGGSILMSQVVSNVPLVALYQPVLLHSGAGEAGFMALAAGSTIAGNLFIFGAASNVLIIQVAEGRKGGTLTFLEFAKVGVPITAAQYIIFWLSFTFS